MTDDRILLELKSISKSFGPTAVLEGIELAVRDGEFITILGPSGSGKTTILRMIGGFTQPSGGEILLEGRDITGLPINRRPFNTVFQDYALFPHMTVAGNVSYGLMVRGRPRREIARKVSEALDLVQLGPLADRYPAQLSGGQRQRVALARALAARPRVLLLDEPFGALDKNLRLDMQIEVKRLQRELDITTIMVTHDQEEALTMSDRIVVMSNGRIEQVGTPDEIYGRPATAFVSILKSMCPKTQTSLCRSYCCGHPTELPTGPSANLGITSRNSPMRDTFSSSRTFVAVTDRKVSL